MNQGPLHNDVNNYPKGFINQFDYYSQTPRKKQTINPERLLNEVATAIKHRCISTTMRWHVVYYSNRICCVPSHENVPPEIILIVFTEQQVQDGFTTKQWDDLKTNITRLYKELHK